MNLGLKRLVTIKANASAGVDPKYYGDWSSCCGEKGAGKSIIFHVEELDLIEANEAFAAQVTCG